MDKALQQGESPTFIVQFWSAIFRVLRQITPLEIIRTLSPPLKNGPYRFVIVEAWALFHLGLALVFLLVANRFAVPAPLRQVFLWWGLVRVFEIIVVQINIVLFDEHRTPPLKYAVRSYRRLIVLLLMNYGEIILWFALSYQALVADFEIAPGMTLVGALSASLAVVTSFGSSTLIAKTPFGASVCCSFNR